MIKRILENNHRILNHIKENPTPFPPNVSINNISSSAGLTPPQKILNYLHNTSTPLAPVLETPMPKVTKELAPKSEINITNSYSSEPIQGAIANNQSKQKVEVVTFDQEKILQTEQIAALKAQAEEDVEKIKILKDALEAQTKEYNHKMKIFEEILSKSISTEVNKEIEEVSIINNGKTLTNGKNLSIVENIDNVSTIDDNENDDQQENLNTSATPILLPTNKIIIGSIADTSETSTELSIDSFVNINGQFMADNQSVDSFVEVDINLMGNESLN